MRIFKHFWKSLTERFKQRALRRAGEFERELSAARQEQQRLRGQLSDRQESLEHELSAAKTELRGLQAELTGLKAGVEQGVSATQQEQQHLREQVAGLKADFERELAETNLEQQTLRGQVSSLRDDLERLRSRDEQLRGELKQRFDRLQAERDATQRQVEVLRASLADAAARQETTETRVNTLELRLQEQRKEHQVALQEAKVRERRQARRLAAAMAVGAAAFVLGIVGGAINFWEVQHTSRLLAEVSQGIRDIRSAMEGHTGSSAQAPVEVEPAAPIRESPPATPESSAPSPATGGSREADHTEPPLSGEKLPAPDFVASRSLPLGEHTFNSRQDVRAFFEENAKQPGVVTLPGGVQYRILIAGTGKSPGARDQVVVEYRAFRPDGTELDNSFKEDLPTTFTVAEAIPALKEALPEMQEGAQWELYIPPELAYKGIRKRGPRGFEPLILTVELLSVVAAQAGSNQ